MHGDDGSGQPLRWEDAEEDGEWSGVGVARWEWTSRRRVDGMVVV